eukprot:scaffold7183_cov60-Phaeocystis_antarctica.AAC.6
MRRAPEKVGTRGLIISGDLLGNVFVWRVKPNNLMLYYLVTSLRGCVRGGLVPQAVQLYTCYPPPLQPAPRWARPAQLGNIPRVDQQLVTSPGALRSSSTARTERSAPGLTGLAFKWSGLSAGSAPPRSATASAAQPPSVMAFSRSSLPGPRSSTLGLPLSLPWEIREVAGGIGRRETQEVKRGAEMEDIYLAALLSPPSSHALSPFPAHLCSRTLLSAPYLCSR